jgi:hypothetical protein
MPLPFHLSPLPLFCSLGCSFLLTLSFSRVFFPSGRSFPFTLSPFHTFALSSTISSKVPSRPGPCTHFPANPHPPEKLTTVFSTVLHNHPCLDSPWSYENPCPSSRNGHLVSYNVPMLAGQGSWGAGIVFLTGPPGPCFIYFCQTPSVFVRCCPFSG